jgi:hypothetical protein
VCLLTRGSRIRAVSKDAQGEVSTGDTAPAGVILGAMGSYHTGAAEHIRLLHDRYPKLGNTAIANKVGCDESTVRDVLARYTRNCSLETLREFQANETDILDAIRQQTLASITCEKLEKANFLQLVTGAAILLDKSRLLNGQPTSIHVTALVDLVGLLRSEQASDE